MKITTLTIIIAVLCLFSSALTAQNLHSFSNAVSIENESNTITGWTGNAAILSDAFDSYHGEFAFRITVLNNNGREARFTFNATIGDVYNIQIWAKTTPNSNNPAFANWQGFQGFSTRVINSSQWSPYNFTLTATSSTPIIRIYAGPIGSPVGRDVLIDAVQVFSQTSMDTEPPTVPQNLMASNITTSTVELAWEPSTDNVAVTEYNIYQDNVLLLSVPGNQTNAVINNLQPLTEYRYFVKALDAMQNHSEAGDTLIVTTLPVAPDTIPPTAPQNLTASNIAVNSVELTWDASTDNVAVTGYDIYQDSVVVLNVPGNQTNAVINNLQPLTEYRYFIKALDAMQNYSAPGDTVIVTTLQIIPDTLPPSVPDGLTASNISSSGLTLNWNPSTDDEVVAGYRVFLSDTLFSTLQGANNTSLNVTGLLPSTSYSFTVAAFDTSGNTSAQSDRLLITTLAQSQVQVFTSENANLPSINWQAMDLYSSGSVGIGTAPNSNYRLSVNGAVRSKEVIVESGWSDFVFEPDYKLLSLEEVEQYILEHGHLKDIPSASEVRENGIGLAKMNTLLLQKVEELTLYMIMADKKIKQLEKLIKFTPVIY